MATRAASLAFLPPRLDGRVLATARLLLPLWLRRSGLRGVTVEGMERLQEPMEAFQEGRSRLLLAFRHPSLDDPAVLAHLLWRDLARAGRPRHAEPGRRRFRPRPHAQFLYDRGIPLWAGEGTGWLLSRLGGCSIQRSKLDLPALRTARALLLDGPHPFAVAPEGATNGHSEVVSPLEPGVAQLALWTADDLQKAGRPEAMTLLPIGLQYRFSAPVWPAIEALLSQLEGEAGRASSDRSLQPDHLYRRLAALAELMLCRLEDYYRAAHHLPLPPLPETATAAEERLTMRLNRLLEGALQVAERGLAVEPHGDLNERCRRLEQAGWDRLYPSTDLPAAPPSALDRGLAGRLAEETAQSLWHMRLVEAFVAVSGRYVREHPSQERFADTLLILWDTLNRIRGGTPGQRPQLGPRQALIRIGEPLAVLPLLAGYRSDRRRAVADLTATLQQRLEGLIVPSGMG